MGLFSSCVFLYYKTPKLSRLKQQHIITQLMNLQFRQGSARTAHLWFTKHQLGQPSRGPQVSVLRGHANTAIKVFLSVGWELRQGFVLEGWVTFHVVLSIGFLSFLAAWQLGSQGEWSIKEPARSSTVFYNLASEVILHCFCPNHKSQGEQVNGTNIKIILFRT